MTFIRFYYRVSSGKILKIKVVQCVQRCTNDKLDFIGIYLKSQYISKISSLFRIPIKKMSVQLFILEFQGVQGVQICTKFIKTYLYTFFRFL